MIDVYEKEILSKTFAGLHQLRNDLPKVRDAFEKNFLAKWSCDGLIFGIYHYQNSFDRFALKLIQPTNANTHKIISISDLKPLNTDGEKLFKAMRNKQSTQEIFNFTFGIAENCYLLSIYINSPALQFFITITKSN